MTPKQYLDSIDRERLKLYQRVFVGQALAGYRESRYFQYALKAYLRGEMPEERYSVYQKRLVDRIKQLESEYTERDQQEIKQELNRRKK